MPNKPSSNIANPFDPQSEMNIDDDVAELRRDRQEAISSARTLDELLKEFDTFSGSTREKGDLFERLVKRILESDPVYKQQFSKVWRWNEWPGRNGEIDTGVDLVAQYQGSDEICAIQCKFYSPSTQVSRKDATNFIVEADRIEASGRIFVSTTDKITKIVMRDFDNPSKPVNLLGLDDLRSRDVSWPEIWNPESLQIKSKRFEPRPDQITARDKVIDGFEDHDRGQLILPCGTGKTFTALQIAEKLVGTGGKLLYLVPSIALLGQTMREWAEQQSIPHRYFGICSDVKAGRTNEDLSISSLEIPVTTDPDKLAPQLNRDTSHAMTVVFSTYQSIEQVIKAQGDSGFDLVICDEAHRTTGVETTNGSGSHFTKVHNADELKAKKRLYMTATPRIYSEAAKNKALKVGQIALYSMDDEEQYGPEFHRMTFHDAVEQNLLSDYKVLVLNIDEAAITAPLQNAIAAGADKELQLDDAAKLVGCASALFDPAPDTNEDESPLIRAIAFANTIKNSKRITDNWSKVVTESQMLLSETARMGKFSLDVVHVDGKMNALERSKKLEWLRESEANQSQVRVLSNARCLTEGVNVPALDAVLFFQPRKSVVDVVQAVGRVMRKAPGKKVGYIVLPIVIPADVEPEDALNDNDRYRVVWEVLQALRSHDERLNAYINQIDLNRGVDDRRIKIIGVGGLEDSETLTTHFSEVTQYQLPGLVIDAFHAKVVEKVGDRQYWDRWAKDVADIATTLESRIHTLIPQNGHVSNASTAEVGLQFQSLLQAMRATTNDSLDAKEAINVVAQHMITEPVFQTLVPEHDFAKSNPVARSLNQFVDLIKEHGLESELENLDSFYQSVKRRAAGLDNSAARRKVLEELYENFFKNALPKEAQRLGVVYTPHEIVDFILHSVNDVLQEEFGKSLSDKGVHILDPFAGMGTFIWRLLANPDLIRDEDLERKFWQELHANEILPLAYYMSSVNVEEAFRERVQERDGEDPGYLAFEGMVWRDTFNAMTKSDGQQASMQFMQENDKRAKRQDETQIGVMIGNPPYSAGQRSVNDANPNIEYPFLEKRISDTFAHRSSSTNKNSLYDHYKMAIRWATDRLPKEGGIVGFVTNASFLDGNADSGVRSCLAEEFTSIYAFNLRGNQRTQGETSRREGGKIFGSGSRAPIAITLFVKNPDALHAGCNIYYKDIGDYLTREEKLRLVAQYTSIAKVEDWHIVKPDDKFDWINLRDTTFARHASMGDDATKSGKTAAALFRLYSGGIQSKMDVWIYDFATASLTERVKGLIDEYSHALDRISSDKSSNFDEITKPRPDRIKWHRELKNRLRRGYRLRYSRENITLSVYRPFVKNNLYADSRIISFVSQIPSMFPNPFATNFIIHIQGPGGSKPFSAIVGDKIPDHHLIEGGQAFSLSAYEKVTSNDSHVLIDITHTHTHLKISRARENLAISVAGVGANKPFSTFITDIVPDLELVTKGQVFPRYHYEKVGDGQ